MTIKEAIENLEKLFSDSTDEEYWQTETFAEAVGIAIEALGKQTHKKPDIKSFQGLMRQRTCYTVHCPDCNDKITVLEFMNDSKRRFQEFEECYKHCHNCGQKLDWRRSSDEKS
jgi:CO dehydrogenase/acetyl-CoA synthase alpha subunit